MARRKTLKTVYLCYDGVQIIGASSTLPKLVNKLSVLDKSYYYFYRNLRGADAFAFTIGGRSLKIERLKYD